MSDDFRARQQAMLEQARITNAGRKPKFGDRMRNPWAGESNPHRDGYFVKQRRTTGRLNPGLWYEMTDGKGEFWSCPAEVMVFVEHIEKREAVNE